MINEFRIIDPVTSKEVNLKHIAKEEWYTLDPRMNIDQFYIGQDGLLVLLDTCGNQAFVPKGRFIIRYV